MDIQRAFFVHDTILHDLWSGVFRESMVHLHVIILSKILRMGVYVVF